MRSKDCKPKDYSKLSEVYESFGKSVGCYHQKGSIENRDGAFIIRCPSCGLYGITDEEGARYLGWLA